MAGVGFDTEVASRVNRYPKRFGGTVPYLIGLLQTLLHYTPQEMEIVVDGKVLHRTVFLLAAGLGVSYGGGMMITPGALVNDGLFQICLVGPIGRFEVLRLVPTTYKGTRINYPHVEILTCLQLNLRTKGHLMAQADGEVIGNLPLELTIKPRHLQLICAPSSGGALTQSSVAGQASRLS